MVAPVHRHVSMHKQTTHSRVVTDLQRLTTGTVLQEDVSKQVPLQNGGERLISEANGLDVSVKLCDGTPESIAESMDAWVLRWLRRAGES